MMEAIARMIEEFAAVDWPNDIIGQQQHFSVMEAKRDQIVAAIRDHFTAAGMEAAASLFTQARTNDLDWAVGHTFAEDE